MSRGRIAGQQGAQCMARSFEPEHRLSTQERFVGRSGSIDLRPGDVAEVEIFLLARNSRAGVRSVAAAAADARNTSLETGGEEQTLERHPVGGFRDRGPFGWLGEDRVDDD